MLSLHTNTQTQTFPPNTHTSRHLPSRTDTHLSAEPHFICMQFFLLRMHTDIYTHIFFDTLFFVAENTHTHKHIALLPNGLCGTVTVTATTASVPAVEQSGVGGKQQQMLRSQLQDYLSLNKLHYCLYYPGIHSPGKSTLQNHCLPSTSVPHTLFPLTTERGRGEDQRERREERSCIGGEHGAYLSVTSVSLSQPGRCVELKQSVG